MVQYIRPSILFACLLLFTTPHAIYWTVVVGSRMWNTSKLSQCFSNGFCWETWKNRYQDALVGRPKLMFSCLSGCVRWTACLHVPIHSVVNACIRCVLTALRHILANQPTNLSLGEAGSIHSTVTSDQLIVCECVWIHANSEANSWSPWTEWLNEWMDGTL